MDVAKDYIAHKINKEIALINITEANKSITTTYGSELLVKYTNA